MPVRAPAHAGTFLCVVPTTHKKENKHEQVQESIACQPKYRFRVLQGPVGKEVYKCVMVFSQQLGCEVVELNVQPDHVHLLVMHSAEAVGIRVDGRPERTYRHTNFYGLSIFEEETLLGQSFLGKGLLRRFGRLEQRDDLKVRSVPGERRDASRAASIGTGLMRNHVLRTW